MTTACIKRKVARLAVLLLAFAVLTALAVTPTLPFPPGPSVAGIIINDGTPTNQDDPNFNPQPDPPGSTVAGIIVHDGAPTEQDDPSFNPQPDPPGGVSGAAAA